MSEIESESPETTLWTGSVSHWHYAGKWLAVILLLGALAATFFLHALVSGGAVPFLEDPTIVWSIRGGLALVALIMYIWIDLDRRSHKYMVTNKRVSVEYGIISKTSNELRVQDIRSINLTTKGLAGLAGIGRVEFSTAAKDDADVIFWNTPGAEKVRDMVRGLQG